MPADSIKSPLLHEFGGQWASEQVGTTDYELIEFPFAPYRLSGGKNILDEHEAVEYAKWMNEFQGIRLDYLSEFLDRSGVRVGAQPLHSSESLSRISAWMSSWYPIVMAEWRGPDHCAHWWIDRRGHRKGYWYPGAEGFSPVANWFETSVGHDIAFLVGAKCQSDHPEFLWRVTTWQRTRGNPGDTRYRLPMLNSKAPNIIPTILAQQLLTHLLELAAGRDRGDARPETSSVIAAIADMVEAPI